MGVLFRPVTVDDYDDVAAVLDAVEPQVRVSAAELRRIDQSLRAGGLVCDRILADVEGVPVGYVVYGHMDWCADPLVWSTLVKVIPDRRRQGIGTALHQRVQEAAAKFGVEELFVEIREDGPAGPGFAQRLGYERIGFEFEAWIDLTGDEYSYGGTPPSRFRADDGLRIQTLAELRESTPLWFDRLHQLYSDLEADIPAPFPTRPVPRETFRQRHVDAPGVIADAFLVAVDGDRWIGLTEMLGIEREPTWLQQELTGVVRSHRGRGVATWLKRVSLAWACQAGYERVRTSNSSLNEGMLAVNTRLGFERGTTYGLWVRSV